MKVTIPLATSRPFSMKMSPAITLPKPERLPSTVAKPPKPGPSIVARPLFPSALAAGGA
jgi:hypothetical protein